MNTNVNISIGGILALVIAVATFGVVVEATPSLARAPYVPQYAINKEELVNSLEYFRSLGFTHEYEASCYVIMKSWLQSPIDNKQEIVDYLDSKQQNDGFWGSLHGKRPKLAMWVLDAYFILDAMPQKSLDPSFMQYDTWAEALNYDGTVTYRMDKYHLVLSWALYYRQLPPWMDELFAFLEADLDWMTSVHMHERSHILYNYVLARRSFPDVGVIVQTTLDLQRADGTWTDGMTYDPIQETAIQLYLLESIKILYPQYSSQVRVAIEKARPYIESVYETVSIDNITYGYFVDSQFEYLWWGVLASVNAGLVEGNTDPTAEALYSQLGNIPPAAVAGADQVLSDADGTGSESVDLDGSASYDPDGSIVSFEWSEGSSVLSTEVSFAREYSIGSHTIVLTVIDDRGATASDEVIVTVRQNEPPIADAGPDHSVYVNDEITFDGSSSYDEDGEIVSYHWDYGDDETGSSVAPSHIYPEVGTYTVTLTVTDNGGHTGMDTSTVIVSEPVPSYDLTISATAGGTTEPAPGTYAYDEGTVVTATAYSDTGYEFVQWVLDGVMHAEATIGILMDTNHILTAEFSELPSPKELTIHVESIEMTVASLWRGRIVYAKALVSIVDVTGSHVEGAKVSGHWEGATTDTDSGNTRPNGHVTLRSNWLWRPPRGTAFKFVVDNVTKDGWIYDREANKETSDSVTY